MLNRLIRLFKNDVELPVPEGRYLPMVDPENVIMVPSLIPMSQADRWGFYDGSMPIISAYHTEHQQFVEVYFDPSVQMWFSSLVNAYFDDGVFSGWIPALQWVNDFGVTNE